MTQAVSKSSSQAQSQQLQQQNQHARDTQTEEHHKSANASVILPPPAVLHITSRTQCWTGSIEIADRNKQAGLNLNLGGALSGAFSSKSKKTTTTNPDGSSTSTEDKQDKGRFPRRLHVCQPHPSTILTLHLFDSTC
jgi:hypothetical protein